MVFFEFDAVRSLTYAYNNKMADRVETVTSLPPCKRHIATHNAEVKSVYYADAPPQRYLPVANVGGLARSFSVASVPTKLADDQDLKAYLSPEGITSWTQPAIVTPNGANLLVVDLAPGGVSMMHRTVSIDFSICTNGEIDHELDGGETVRLRPGVSKNKTRVESLAALFPFHFWLFLRC